VASRGLIDINTNPNETDRVIAEITEASTAYMRTLTELPQKAFTRFKEELLNTRKGGSAKRKASSKKSTRHTRSVRAKE
jgi:hypothetical protein